VGFLNLLMQSVESLRTEGKKAQKKKGRKGVESVPFWPDKTPWADTKEGGGQVGERRKKGKGTNDP